MGIGIIFANYSAHVSIFAFSDFCTGTDEEFSHIFLAIFYPCRIFSLSLLFVSIFVREPISIYFFSRTDFLLYLIRILSAIFTQRSLISLSLLKTIHLLLYNLLQPSKIHISIFSAYFTLINILYHLFCLHFPFHFSPKNLSLGFSF